MHQSLNCKKKEQLIVKNKQMYAHARWSYHTVCIQSILSHRDKCFVHTHFGHSSVREETCCETTQQASNFQGTHVWATYEGEYIDSPGITKKMFLNRKWRHLFFHTNKSRLALVLNEEQLAPVGADRLHTEHHHVGPRQQPQVGWQQELGQGALIAGGSWTGNSINCQSCVFVCISNITQRHGPGRF